MALISERIFELLKKRGITQKEFAEKTEIAESTISDWKRRGSNPASEKILIISEVLGVSVEELLSGAKPRGNRSRDCDYLVITRNSEEGELLRSYDEMNRGQKERLMGYMKALMEARENG